MKRFGLAAVSLAALALAACTDVGGSGKSLAPIPPKTLALMSEKGMATSDPILVRVYKKESELEVWKRVNGQYAHLKTFPICRWSGQLGPKVREGDRQAPEGFYQITPGQMNPNSAYYLSFNTGYPNAFDRAHNRTGNFLMVHGTCSSAGCYAMTDEGIAEVYAIAREAFSGGQKAFQFQAYPFRMTAENLARYRQDPNMPFWKNLKQGSDHFEITRREPKVAVCAGRYAFDTVGDGCKDDPTLAPAVAQKEDDDRRQVAELVAKGIPAVRTVYTDGSGHESFRPAGSGYAGDSGSALALFNERPRPNLGEVSRPDALLSGPREIAMDTPAKPAGAGSTLARMANAEAARVEAAAAPTRTGSVRAKPGRTVLASADPDAPIGEPAAPAPARPAHKAEPKRSAAAPLAGRPADPKRPEPAKRAEPAKPADKKAPRRQTASASGEKTRTLSGSAPVGPSTTAFKMN